MAVNSELHIVTKTVPSNLEAELRVDDTVSQVRGDHVVAKKSGLPPEELEIENEVEDAVDFDSQKCEIEKNGEKTKVIIHSHDESNAG